GRPPGSCRDGGPVHEPQRGQAQHRRRRAHPGRSPADGRTRGLGGHHPHEHAAGAPARVRAGLGAGPPAQSARDPRDGAGFAADSARGDEPAYDDIVQAASGVADTYRLRDGEPRYSPYVVADKVCGMTMAQSALAALHRRAVDGEGCWVDVPMVDTMAAFTLVEHMGGTTFAPAAGDVGWSRVLAPEHRPHPALDGWVCVMPYTDANWRRFCSLIERPDYLTHPQVATNRARSASPPLYEQILAEYAAPRTCAQIEEECTAAAIPGARVARIDDLADDPYLAARPQ